MILNMNFILLSLSMQNTEGAIHISTMHISPEVRPSRRMTY